MRMTARVHASIEDLGVFWRLSGSPLWPGLILRSQPGLDELRQHKQKNRQVIGRVL